MILILRLNEGQDLHNRNLRNQDRHNYNLYNHVWNNYNQYNNYILFKIVICSAISVLFRNPRI